MILQVFTDGVVAWLVFGGSVGENALAGNDFLF